jgi:hypothetical protein
MAYAFVFLVAVGVAVAVYVTTVRGGQPIADGFGPEAATPGSGDGGTYVPVTATRPDWQSRLTGFLGLLIAVVVAAIVVAASLYVGVSWLVETIGDLVTRD